MISVFNFVSLDGFFAGPNGEIDWFKDLPEDKEYADYTHSQSQSGSTLLFGRTTYEMMKSFWPTEEARKMEPEMAKVMNDSPKIVFSKTMKPVADEQYWKNVTVLSDLSEASVKNLSARYPGGLTILGSGTIVQQLSNLRLIDVYSLAVVPVILGQGKQLFKDVQEMKLKHAESKSFRNGVVISNYIQWSSV
jgi:dihydrofolate reductase